LIGRRAAAPIAAILVAGTGEAQADVMVLSSVADNTMFVNAATPTDLLSSGSGDSMYSGRTSGIADIRSRALVRFDVSGIPCGANITSVALTVKVAKTSGGASNNSIALHRVLAGWGEGASNSFGGGGDASQAGDANWYERLNPGVMWTNAGGDYQATASAAVVVGNPASSVTWTSTDALITDVKGWVNASSTNFGWLIRNDESVNSTVRKFSTREAAVAADRPSLRIEYTMPCPADFNCDTFLDFTDFDEFVSEFESGGVRVDCNGDGFLDFTDFDAFVGAFESGC